MLAIRPRVDDRERPGNIAGRRRAVGNMDSSFVDVHQTEQMLMHESMVRLQRLRVHRVVLIEIKCCYVPEGEPLLRVHPHKFPVHAHRSRPSG